MSIGDLAEDDVVTDVPRAWQPRRWWAWSIGSMLAGLAALLGAGVRFTDVQFGTTLRDRACDAAPAGGFALLVVGGLLLALGITFARLGAAGSMLVVDAHALALSLPLPATLLAATMPGVLGCRIASDISELALVGDALVGTSGLLLASAAAVLVGVALASCAHVAWLAPSVAVEGPPPSIVELAMREADALEHDPAAQRFHGVDSGDA